MLAVRTEPFVEPEQTEGWEFVLWLDDDPPDFRSFLAALAAALAPHGGAELELPPCRQAENLVFGALAFAGRRFNLYFEDDFAPYVAIYAPDRAAVADLLERLRPALARQRGRRHIDAQRALQIAALIRCWVPTHHVL